MTDSRLRRNYYDLSSVLTVMLTLVAVCVGYTFVYCIFPGFSDELWYTLPFRHWQEGGGAYPVGAILGEVSELNNEENIRGAIVFHILTAWIPRPLMGLLTGSALFLTFFIGARICGVGVRTPMLSVAGIAAYIFCFPWHEAMFTQVFAYNYVWSSMLSLAAVWIFFRGDFRGTGVPEIVCVSLLPLILGIWHEGFSVPLFIGFAVYALLNFRKMDARRWILTIGLLPGIFLQFASPGTQLRLAHQIGWAVGSAGDTLILLMSHPLSILYLIVLVIILCTPSLRRSVPDDCKSFLIFAAVVALSVLVIHARAVRQLRVAWPGELFSLAGVIIILSHLIGRKWVLPSLRSVAISVPVFILLCVHVIYVDIYGCKISRQDKVISARFKESADGVVFADFLTEYDAPFIVLKRPWFEMYTSSWYKAFASQYYSDSKYPNIIPSALRNVPFVKARKIPGLNPFYSAEGHIFAKAPYGKTEVLANFETNGFWTLSFGEYEKTVKVRYSYFRGRDNRWYVYLYPERIYRDLASHDIAGIYEWQGAQSIYVNNPDYDYQFKPENDEN